MSDARDDGGHAFPLQGASAHNGQYGMTLRDWFAGNIVNAMISGAAGVPMGVSFPETNIAYARAAYAVADAMLAARSK